MVRLQQKIRRDCSKFERGSQFHYGSITTVEPQLRGKNQSSLNSTMVRLQLSKTSFKAKDSVLSQFHYGSITTTPREGNYPLAPGSQFHYGSITTVSEGKNIEGFALVSIPLWFDYNRGGPACHSPRKTVSIPLWFDYNKTF